MGQKQGNLSGDTRQTSLMTKICEDIGAGGEDEMIDMQARIGTF